MEARLSDVIESNSIKLNRVRLGPATRQGLAYGDNADEREPCDEYRGGLMHNCPP